MSELHVPDSYERSAGKMLKALLPPEYKAQLDKETPRRYLRALWELTSGYREHPDQYVKMFDSPCDSMVVTTGISFVSLCEHHVLPYWGKAVVGYIPDGRVLGLSKFPRIIRCFSRRLTTQENLVEEISSFLYDRLEPKGIGVILKAVHTCASLRGVEEESMEMVVSSVKGLFLDHQAVRDEFLRMVSI